VKTRLKYDDSLDVFGVHGVGGILGMLMVGVFATASLSASGDTAGVSGLIEGNARQLWVQAVGVVVTVVWSAIGTWVVLKIVDALSGLRVDAEKELEGVDIALHGEAIHQ
jgi:Amt family ammonium transporter